MKCPIIARAPILRYVAVCGAFALALVGLSAICSGQRRSRVSPLKVVQLPEPSLTGSLAFEQALVKQRAVGLFTGQPLKFTQIGQLAWAGQGKREPQTGFQVTPRADDVYLVRLYFTTQDGVYVYNPDGHSLQQTLAQDVRGALAATTLNQEAVVSSGCSIILTSSVRNRATRYANAARRLVLLQAGQIAQNIQLQAVTLELGFTPIGDFDTTGVRRICSLPRNVEPLYIISVGYAAEQAAREQQEGQISAGTKRAALIVARENFRDEELFETARVLDTAGVQTFVASARIGPIPGILGGLAEARIPLSELRVDDYDAIVFVGGLGAREYFVSPVALNIAREAAAKGKVLAAISIAPTVLANAGVLAGVRVTSFASERERLVLAGAIYTGAPVERHGLIITAVGPLEASQFGRAIAEALAGR